MLAHHIQVANDLGLVVRSFKFKFRLWLHLERIKKKEAEEWKVKIREHLILNIKLHNSLNPLSPLFIWTKSQTKKKSHFQHLLISKNQLKPTLKNLNDKLFIYGKDSTWVDHIYWKRSPSNFFLSLLVFLMKKASRLRLYNRGRKLP